MVYTYTEHCRPCQQETVLSADPSNQSPSGGVLVGTLVVTRLCSGPYDHVYLTKNNRQHRVDCTSAGRRHTDHCC